MVMRKTRSEQNKVCSQNDVGQRGRRGRRGRLVRRRLKNIMLLVFCRRVFRQFGLLLLLRREDFNLVKNMKHFLISRHSDNVQRVCYQRHDDKEARVRYVLLRNVLKSVAVLGKRSSMFWSALISALTNQSHCTVLQTDEVEVMCRLDAASEAEPRSQRAITRGAC